MTEDTQSSKTYFGEIRVEHHIPEANVVVVAGSGSDPVSVVDTAVGQTFAAGGGRDAFDRVFVVIDRDRHVNFGPALTKLQQFNADAAAGTRRVRKWTRPRTAPRDRQRFELILSDPCFELWLLLHFTPWTAPFGTSNLGSNCARVQRELKKPGRLPDYDKGQKGWWARTKDLYASDAKPNAIAGQAALTPPTKDPSSSVYEVVDAILEIGRQKQT